VHSDYVLLLWPISIYSVGVRSILKKGFVFVFLFFYEEKKGFAVTPLNDCERGSFD
jgi:hypothetical protein